jgi:coenzyme F420-reducing hydrogenase gamma subunit
MDNADKAPKSLRRFAARVLAVGICAFATGCVIGVVAQESEIYVDSLVNKAKVAAGFASPQDKNRVNVAFAFGMHALT